MRTLAIALLLALALSPLEAAGRKPPVIQNKPAADPLEAWFEADDLVAQGEPGKALAALRRALELVGRTPESARVNGPGGASWTRKEALFRYSMRAADVASLTSWREARELLEQAVKLAFDRPTREEAQLQLEAAQAQIAAGHDRAPSFLGDDPARLADDPAAAPLLMGK